MLYLFVAVGLLAVAQVVQLVRQAFVNRKLLKLMTNFVPIFDAQAGFNAAVIQKLQGKSDE